MVWSTTFQANDFFSSLLRDNQECSEKSSVCRQTAGGGDNLLIKASTQPGAGMGYFVNENVQEGQPITAVTLKYTVIVTVCQSV